MLGVNDKLLDFIYPIGSYYETSDTSFDPNVSWGGTWLEDSKGLVTVALDSDDIDFDTINETGGSKNLQAHNHLVVKGGNGTETLSQNNTIALYSVNSDLQYSLRALSSQEATDGKTSTTGTGDSGNLQPYIVVKRWHRTA